ncbi:HupE/UreJ family protein [Lacisediminimonas profundi]|uniref:HupE/UreJ family protein n=1 Tax=Lacisediminimonas profundi TaxID=2603856 RepID=UPI00124B49C7|nr:HupE/UreJ family protein [Lacisediminimonas profundi]
MKRLHPHLRLLLLLLWLALLSPAQAHKPSDSYLALTVEGNTVRGQWDIALRDLDFALGLDSSGDGSITWGELKQKQREIEAYALARLSISSSGQSCALAASDHLVDDHTDGAYEVMRFEARCPSTGNEISIRYGLFFDIDPQHKGLLRLQRGGTVSTGVFTPDTGQQVFSLSQPSRLQQFADYAAQGVWHIWIGFDHILFLMALLLPAVAVRVARRWEPVPAFWPALVNVASIVTAFTIAHSITLTLATLGVVSLPSRLVESTIALSVVIAALNNIFPLFAERRWVMAFLFGLIHGFGFASVLSDLGLPSGTLAIALVGFNLGVEAGQLAIVCAFLPVAYRLRSSIFYKRWVLIGGSALIAILACVWLTERVFDLKLISG